MFCFSAFFTISSCIQLEITLAPINSYLKSQCSYIVKKFETFAQDLKPVRSDISK